MRSFKFKPQHGTSSEDESDSNRVQDPPEAVDYTIMSWLPRLVYLHYSQTKWSLPLKIALMNWLFETWTR